MKPIVFANTKDLSREEWLRLRRQGIGGSDAASILGLNPYSSAIDVYADKLGLIEPKEETESMWLGNVLEPFVAKRFEKETGMSVQRRNAILQHPDHPWMIANVDRMVVGQKAGLEIKTTSLFNKTRFADGEVPLPYYVQMLHYLAVTGATDWYLVVLVLGRSLHVFHVQRNESEVDALIQAEKNFWENHVLKQIPPPPDGSEAAGEMLKRLFPKERGDGFMVPLYGKEVELQRIITLEDEIKTLEKESDALKQQVQLEIGEADGGIAAGFKVYWKSQSRSSIDTRRLQKDQPGIYADYAKTTSYRKFEIKKEEPIHG